MVATGITIFLACICVASVHSKPSVGTGLCTETLPYADPDNCAKFWVCAPYGPQQMDCAPGTLFNPKIYVCDWPYNVECNPKTTTTEEPKTEPPTTTTTTTEAPVETTTERLEPTTEPETETPESETESPEPETETPEPEIETPEPEIEAPEP